MSGLLDEGEVAELAALMQGWRTLNDKDLQAAMVRLSILFRGCGISDRGTD